MATLIRSIGTSEDVTPANGVDFRLKELQGYVGGHIEIVYLADGRLMVINEEGKLEELPVNAEATRLFLIDRMPTFEAARSSAVIVGDVLVCASWELR